MDILINGLALPKKGHCTIVAVFSDGSVDYRDREEMAFHRTKAVALPEHGDLKDETDIIHRIEENIADTDVAQDIIGEILASPTIVEAST